jgi:predicted nucleic acid-binding protein
MKLLDTCFLIDLQREFRDRKAGPARRYLAAHAADTFAISTVSLTEFLEGFEDPADGEMLLRPFRWLPVNTTVAREAAVIRRRLRLEGKLIGDFDILIVATARVGKMGLVTKDGEHFKRVAGLAVEAYA